MDSILPVFYRKLISVLGFVFLSCLPGAVNNASAQNLVPNASLEDYTLCPDQIDQMDRVTYWRDPTGLSSDYYNACCPYFCTSGVPNNMAGDQVPRSGNAYAGFILFSQYNLYREYIEVPLVVPLVADTRYEVSFYVSLADLSRFATASIGAYFSEGPIDDIPGQGNLPFTPQVVNAECNLVENKEEWTLIHGTFIAAGGEDHMVIGNFEDDSGAYYKNVGGGISYAYYYIDDVAVAVCQHDWIALGAGTNSVVNVLTSHDDGSCMAIYAGGVFTTAGGSSAQRIARWDGSSWSTLGSGINGQVLALASFDGDLYAAGMFTVAGGVSVSNIARWDGISWLAVGSGVNGAVNAMIAHNDGAGEGLYVGGDFSSAGGVTANNIAKFDGSTWEALDLGLGGDSPNSVRDLAIYDYQTSTALVALGQFTTAGEVAVENVAQWMDGDWSNMGIGIPSDLPITAGTLGSELWVGGYNFVYIWDGMTWGAHIHIPNGNVLDFTVYDDGDGDALYAAGDFTYLGSYPINHVGKWNGSTWTPLGYGPDHTVLALTSTQNALYAGGYFLNTGNENAAHVARWGCIDLSDSFSAIPTITAWGTAVLLLLLFGISFLILRR